MDSFEAKICTRMKKDGHVFKQTPSRGRKRRQANVSPRFASDCSSRVLARARNKTTRRRAKPMEENIVDVLCTRRCRLRRSRSTNHPFPRSRTRPMIIQSFVSFFFICLSVRRIFPSSESRSTSLFAPARTLHPSSDAQI